MIRDDDHLPFRQATRVINEFQMGVGRVMRDVAAGDISTGIVLTMVFREALRGTCGRISVNAIATSLQRSTETVRRHAHHLVAPGWCEPGPAGLRLAPAFLMQPAIVTGGDAVLALFHRMLDTFAGSGFVLPAGLATRSRERRLRAALDIYLATFELAEEPVHNWQELYVLGAITVHNASGITHDPQLARDFGFPDTLPPRSIRRPLTLKALSARERLPHATVWRHATRLKAKGMIEEVAGGYLLREEFLFAPALIRRSRAKVRHAAGVLAAAARGE